MHTAYGSRQRADAALYAGGQVPEVILVLPHGVHTWG
jgi:hypothetical protein